MKESTKVRFVAATLVACIATVGFWEFMASRSRRPLDAFRITASDFVGFEPVIEGYSARKLPVDASPIEPNVLAVELRVEREAASAARSCSPVLVRLAHGYNMPDCMRIKGYEVAEMGSDQLPVIGDQFGTSETEAAPKESRGPVVTGSRGPEETWLVQCWRLTSDIGDVSVWTTSMIRTGDFGVTGTDVRTMAFPRIGTPDDPRWLPQGITLRSFRHPVRNFRWLIRSKWNNARCDLGTFLKLKRPAWADDSLMTFVSVWKGAPLKPEQELAATAHVLAVHRAVLAELQCWRRSQTTDHGPRTTD